MRRATFFTVLLMVVVVGIGACQSGEVSTNAVTNAVTKKKSPLYATSHALNNQGSITEGARVLVTGLEGGLCAVEWVGGDGWVMCTNLNLDDGVKLMHIDPPPTPTPRPSVGVRSNPVPVGQAKDMQQMSNDGGDPIQFQFTILEVLQGDAAWQRVYAANEFNVPAPASWEFIMVRVGASYTGPDSGTLEIGEYGVYVVAEGRVLNAFDVENACCLAPEFDFTLLPGGTAEGWFAWPIPPDPAPMLLLGSPDSGVYFSLAP